jgi:hypothetical protein
MREEKGFKVVDVPENFDLMEVDSSYTKSRFKRKNHGIKGFFTRVKDDIKVWWSGLKKRQKIALETCASRWPPLL